MNTSMQCPKCRGGMQTHNRNGIHIEQCGNCRGIFLDFGELEALTQLQAQWMQQQMQQQMPVQQMPPQQMPPWVAPPPAYGHGYHKQHKRGLMGMLFSS